MHRDRKLLQAFCVRKECPYIDKPLFPLPVLVFICLSHCTYYSYRNDRSLQVQSCHSWSISFQSLSIPVIRHPPGQWSDHDSISYRGKFLALCKWISLHENVPHYLTNVSWLYA